ncbi:hypothetical protein [Sphingobacterium kitahiroshimense]|uniref:SMODS-associating 2TM beta-strand rich effector domain-containing protein n=1 Tax=Sphingobacterium kitahiroshimense TaxID=470446 RepID=A0ABV0C115_9SPHI
MKKSRILLIFMWIIIFSISTGIVISTLLLKQWNTLTAGLAIIASLLTVYGSIRLNWRLEDAHEPYINIYFDTKSHKYATSLVLRNDGGSTAYNIEIHWDNPLIDSDGKILKFIDEGIDVYSLPVGEKVSTYVNNIESFFSEDKPLEIYSGNLIYYSTPRSKTKIKQPFILSMHSFAKSIMTENDQTSFYFENRQLTKSVKELKVEVSKLSSKLDKRK